MPIIFKTLLVSFLTSSGITFGIDIYIGRKDVFAEYIKILTVSLENIAYSFPIFFFFEKRVEKRISEKNFLSVFFLWLTITDVFFYIFHRLLHTRRFYKYHSLHHSYRLTFGPVALYSSFTEFIISNVLPNLISFEILNLGINEIIKIIIFQIFYTVIVSHGGYSFLSQGHLKHHLTNKAPYGIFLTDRIVGRLIF